jgi:hypothetical protein
MTSAQSTRESSGRRTKRGEVAAAAVTFNAVVLNPVSLPQQAQKLACRCEKHEQRVQDLGPVVARGVPRAPDEDRPRWWRSRSSPWSPARVSHRRRGASRCGRNVVESRRFKLSWAILRSGHFQ